jgi:hypothetical protein
LLLVSLVVVLSLAGAAAAEGGDANAPQIVLYAPVDGATFYQGQSVQAAFACLPGALGWPVISCAADVALDDLLDTQSVGTHTFTVRAEDYAGAVTTVTDSYTVIDVVSPVVTVTTLADRAVYDVGAGVSVDYRCDDPGGSGVQACIGSLPNGAPLPTGHLGSFGFDVTAFDWAGNSSTVHLSYQVVDRTPPTISISRPAAPVGDRVPAYTLGQLVSADYSCSDSDGSGVVACLGDVPSGSALNTSNLGLRALTVVARDAARNSATSRAPTRSSTPSTASQLRSHRCRRSRSSGRAISSRSSSRCTATSARAPSAA